MTTIADLNARHNFFIRSASYIAERSTIRTFKTGAIVVDQFGSSVARGWSHTNERLQFKQYRSIHAELHALIGRRHIQNLRDCTIYIATIRTKSGNIGMAKPCQLCESLLYEAGIAVAVFTTGNGFDYEVMRLSKDD